jgi:hypothetical protein
MVASFALWSIMVQRKIYREVESTKFAYENT